MKRSENTELRNLYLGDYLLCQACGTVIFGPVGKFHYFREFTKAYWKHVKECFAIKRLIVSKR